jgi:hypothetical protein
MTLALKVTINGLMILHFITLNGDQVNHMMMNNRKIVWLLRDRCIILSGEICLVN